MEKPKAVNSCFDELPCQPVTSKKYVAENSIFQLKNKLKTEKSQEDIIRSLQNSFCKGRYRSWIFTQVKRS
jgi:NADH:ubiquinone oxidoreductase subunit F (NADH-binding)